MRSILFVTLLVSSLGAPCFAASNDPKDILPLLKNAKLTLQQGIAEAQKRSGTPVSAKFEAEDGKLMLSVYTIPEGLGAEAESATLSEFGADAGELPFKPSVEVFTDKEHLARASVHMTLFKLSRMSLSEVIAKALSVQPGAPIDVRNPAIRNHRAVADVVIVDDQDEVSTVTVDLQSGRARLSRN